MVLSLLREPRDRANRYHAQPQEPCQGLADRDPGTHEGGQIEVHASNANGPLLTHGPFASGTTTLPIDKPQDVDTIVVRITKLPMSPGADRPYRATATEITFK